MAKETRLQAVLMRHIRKTYPAKTAEKIAEILDVSRSNAYKRLNGKKPMSLDEAYTLCNHLGINLEDIIPKSNGQIVANMASIDQPFEKLDDYPNYLLRLLRHINSISNSDVVYLTNEIPVCYFFTSPLLAAFKMYVWSRNIFHQRDLRNRIFQPNLIINNPNFDEMCNDIISRYEKIPRTEIWTDGVLKRTISQVEYCRKNKLFHDKNIGKKLIEELKTILQKNLSDTPYYSENAEKRVLYSQPYFSAEDIFLIRSPYKKQVIATFFNPDYLISSDRRLVKKSEERLMLLIDKSDSVNGEYSRKAFLGELLKELDSFLEEDS